MTPTPRYRTSSAVPPTMSAACTTSTSHPARRHSGNASGSSVGSMHVAQPSDRALGSVLPAAAAVTTSSVVGALAAVVPAAQTATAISTHAPAASAGTSRRGRHMFGVAAGTPPSWLTTVPVIQVWYNQQGEGGFALTYRYR